MIFRVWRGPLVAFVRASALRWLLMSQAVVGCDVMNNGVLLWQLVSRLLWNDMWRLGPVFCIRWWVGQLYCVEWYLGLLFNGVCSVEVVLCYLVSSNTFLCDLVNRLFFCEWVSFLLHVWVVLCSAVIWGVVLPSEAFGELLVLCSSLSINFGIDAQYKHTLTSNGPWLLVLILVLC